LGVLVPHNLLENVGRGVVLSFQPELEGTHVVHGGAGGRAPADADAGGIWSSRRGILILIVIVILILMRGVRERDGDWSGAATKEARRRLR
jgi:hypothetical protein